MQTRTTSTHNEIANGIRAVAAVLNDWYAAEKRAAAERAERARLVAEGKRLPPTIRNRDADPYLVQQRITAATGNGEHPDQCDIRFTNRNYAVEAAVKAEAVAQCFAYLARFNAKYVDALSAWRILGKMARRAGTGVRGSSRLFAIAVRLSILSGVNI